MGDWTLCVELKWLWFNRSSRWVLLRTLTVKSDRKTEHLELRNLPAVLPRY